MSFVEFFRYRNVDFIPAFIYCFVATKNDYGLLFWVKGKQDSYGARS